VSSLGGVDLGSAFGGSGAYDLSATSGTGDQGYAGSSSRSVGGNTYRSTLPDNPVNTYAMIALGVLALVVISKAVR